MRFLAVCFLLTGCPRIDYSARPGQSLAEQVVWRDTYGMTDHEPPRVAWVYADRWGEDNGATLAGVEILVACGDECDWTWPYTAYAHELLHYRSLLRNGDVDPEHKREDWNLVSVAYRALEVAEH